MSEAEGSAFPELRSVSAGAPLSWIAAGRDDLLAAPGASLFYGGALVAMGYLLIVTLIFAGMASLYAGLAITAPLIGHATWHAYRALVAPPVNNPLAQV